MAERSDFRPYVDAQSGMPELTFRAVAVGTLLGIVFGASSLYLTLKVGLTVSASIPVAVISMALFKIWKSVGGKDATILEHNIVQTAGSAGESIAFGVGVCMPAILILGFDLEITRVALVAVLGGLLGILMMIPLRRALIVDQHETLKYPEGTACAQVLQASQATGKDAVNAQAIFLGFGIGLLYKVGNVALKLWKDVPEKIFSAPLKAGSISCEISPELLGVGYIIGPRIASVMAAGGVLSYLLLIPMIQFFGENMTTVLAPGTKLISAMSPHQIRSAYILYIGAGAVATGGIISLLRAFPTIWHGLKSGLSDFHGVRGDAKTLRTERDLPMKFVLVGCIILLAVISLAAPLHMNLLGALMIVVFGFIFVTVSSRLTGEIGSSSNPISGMTIATLLFTCLIFLAVGWTGNKYYVTALSVGAIVCVAASNGGTTSQDLKTGYLLGGTPKYQQIAILIGSLASSLCLGPILLGLNQTATVYAPAPAGLIAPAEELVGARSERINGSQAAGDSRFYRLWHHSETTAAAPGQYLVDETGRAIWLVDPGINGTLTQRPDGSAVRKFDAPKAVLVSYIIKGILDHKLPWSLVLFGVMIALVLEMSGIPSLAFAVGVYLPISSSLPLFVGGCIRWLVDRYSKKQPGLNELDRIAETDKSPGVLLASGYIAGGAIAGIVIAFLSGGFERIDTALGAWATAHNPFFAGAHADALALLPFAIICAVLFFVGKKKPAASR